MNFKGNCKLSMARSECDSTGWVLSLWGRRHVFIDSKEVLSSCTTLKNLWFAGVCLLFPKVRAVRRQKFTNSAFFYSIVNAFLACHQLRSNFPSICVYTGLRRTGPDHDQSIRVIVAQRWCILLLEELSKGFISLAQYYCGWGFAESLADLDAFEM